MKNKTNFFHNLILGVSIALLVAFMAAAIPNSYACEHPNPYVFPRDSIQFGRSYGDWAAAWWQWAFSIPVATHPLFDDGDNRDCSVGQSGPVFFLGGKFCSVAPGAPPCTAGTATRYCTVSRKKAIFFPIAAYEDSTVEEEFSGYPGLTIAELRLGAAGIIDQISVEAEIDGHPVKDLAKSFRVQSTVFEFTVPNDNFLKAIYENAQTSFAAGTYSPSVADGVYLMLEGLHPGNHVIHFTAHFGSTLITDITYNLTVVP